MVENRQLQAVPGAELAADADLPELAAALASNSDLAADADLPELANLPADLADLATDLSKLAADLPDLTPDLAKLAANLPDLAANLPDLAADLPDLAADLALLAAAVKLGWIAVRSNVTALSHLYRKKARCPPANLGEHTTPSDDILSAADLTELAPNLATNLTELAAILAELTNIAALGLAERGGPGYARARIVIWGGRLTSWHETPETRRNSSRDRNKVRVPVLVIRVVRVVRVTVVTHLGSESLQFSQRYKPHHHQCRQPC